MKKLIKILLRIILVLSLLVIAAFAYLNLIYLPHKVKSVGPVYLEEKSNGRIKAESIQYIPFRGLRLKGVAIYSKAKAEQPSFIIDKADCNISLWSLIIRKHLVFSAALYPAQIQRSFILKGVWRHKQKSLDLILASADLNVQGSCSIKDEEIYIKKLKGNILQSRFDLKGKVHNLSEPLLSLNGELRIKKLVFKDLTIISKLKNKQLTLAKCYARIYGGELNLEGLCRLDAQGTPANLNLNIFNLDLHKIIEDISGKDLPIHGRCFALAKVSGHLQDPQAVTGTMWVSASGSNILELPILSGLAEVLHLPELRRVEFKEASGNFTIGKQQIRTSDFKIVSNNIVLYYKGYIDFAGNLSFDIQPYFSAGLLKALPNLTNVLGIFMDSAGNFLGEIKMKGTIKKVRHTFKPFSKDKLLPHAIEEGIKQFLKFKEKGK